MSFALSLAALALLVAAATTDALDRRIPNALSVGLALVGLARIALDLARAGRRCRWPPTSRPRRRSSRSAPPASASA